MANEGEEKRPSAPAMDDQTSNNNNKNVVSSESHDDSTTKNVHANDDDDDEDDDLKRAKAAALEASKGGPMSSNSSDEHQKALLEKHTASSHRNLFFHTTEKLVKGAPTPIQDLHKNWMKQHDQMNQNLTNQLNKFGIKLPGQGHGHAHAAPHDSSTSDEQQPSQHVTTAAVVADDHNATSKLSTNEAISTTTMTSTTESNQMDDTTLKTTPTEHQPPISTVNDDKKAATASTGEGGVDNEDDDDRPVNNEDGEVDDTAEGTSSSGPVAAGGTSRRSVVGGGGGGKLRLSNPLGLKKPAAASVVPSNVKKAFTSIAAGRKKSYQTSSSSTVDEDGEGEGNGVEPASTQETTISTSTGAATDAVVSGIESSTVATTETTITGEGSSSSSAEPTSASVFRSPPTTADTKNGTATAATGATANNKNVVENDKQGSSSTEVTNTMHKKKKDVAVVNKTMEETKEATKARNAIAALASFDDTTPKASPSSNAELVVPPTHQLPSKQQLRSASTPNIVKAIVPQQQQQPRLGGGSEPKVSALHASYSSNMTSPSTIKTTNHDLVSSAAVPSLDLNSGSFIRSTIVWKRRDGLGGKFANLALLKQSPLWERRKLVLEDSKLSYFVLSDQDKLDDWATQAALRAEAEAAAKSPAAGAGGGGGIQDIVHWWHETTAHATADVMSAVTGGAVGTDSSTTSSTATTTTPSTPTTSSVNSNTATAAATGIAGPEGPRGTIDLLKENASIMTSTCSNNYGMGGVVGTAGATAAVVGATSNTAPTPFCLTIKIHDQHAVKWKLCFDSHQQQLEWLVLLSNRSTIQSSIEEFVVDQSKSIAGGARMTCTLDPNTGLYVVKHRDNLLGSPTTTPTATTKKQAKKASDSNIPPPPPPIDTTTTAPPDNSHNDPTMTLPRMTPSTKRTSPNTQSTVVSRGQAPKGTLSLRELTNHNTELPFLLLPSIWKRHYMYHTYVKPWLQISLSKQPTTTKTKKSKKSKSSSPKQPPTTTNVYYPYQPPITLYLIGDRLDLLLWICNICIIASYVHGEEWSLMKFVGFITMFNLMASLCCCQLEDFKLMGYASHEDAAAFADRVAQRTSDEIQPRTPKSPARRGVWGFGKQRRSATTTTQQQSPQQQSSGGDLSTSGDSATDVTMEETKEEVTAVAMVTEEEEDIESESEDDEEEEPGEERRRKVAFDGIAGSTTVKFSSDTTPTKAFENPQCLIGWRPLASKEIMLRDVGYATTKQKVPSPHSLYECVAVDVFQSSERIPNFVTQVKQLNRFLLKDSNSTNKFASPDLFVLTIALPCDAPKLGKPVDDGNGTTIVAYFRMTRETRQVLKFLQQVKDEAASTTQKQTNPTISSDHVSEIAKTLPTNIQNIEALIKGVKLFETWCDLSYHKKDATFQSRFKFLPQAVNSEEFGMPSYMAKYNGKPVLIKRAGVTGTLSNYPSLKCMEFDMNLHAFPYLAKQAFAYMKDAFCPYIVGNMACCIEGRSDAELPECLLGGFQIWYPDPTYTPTIEQFFAPSSSTQEETSENANNDKPSKQ